MLDKSIGTLRGSEGSFMPPKADGSFRDVIGKTGWNWRLGAKVDCPYLVYV